MNSARLNIVICILLGQEGHHGTPKKKEHREMGGESVALFYPVYKFQSLFRGIDSVFSSCPPGSHVNIWLQGLLLTCFELDNVCVFVCVYVCVCVCVCVKMDIHVGVS